MCFYNDYDWYAEVTDKSEPEADKDVRCHECRETIKQGSKYVYIFMQEHEECHNCNDEDEDFPCSCEEPNFGGTFEYQRCLNCECFLEAVQEAEKEAGCDYQDSRPGLTAMVEAIRDGGKEEAKAYFKKAAKMFPELVTNEYLKRLWRKVG